MASKQFPISQTLNNKVDNRYLQNELESSGLDMDSVNLKAGVITVITNDVAEELTPEQLTIADLVVSQHTAFPYRETEPTGGWTEVVGDEMLEVEKNRVAVVGRYQKQSGFVKQRGFIKRRA